MRNFQRFLLVFALFCFLAGFAGTAWAADSEAAADARLNINTASIDQLTTLKGIGPALAERIVDYRQSKGEFASVDDLLQVKGIGEKTLANIRDSITAGPSEDTD